MEEGVDAAAAPARSIRFEDLGEPIQRLLKELKGDMDDEDMALLEFVSVKDMAKIYSEMGTDRHIEEIWVELREALQSRKEKASREEQQFLERQQKLEEEQLAEREQRRLQDEEEERERAAAEVARQRRQEELQQQQQKEQHDAAAGALAARVAAEEAAAAAEEEERFRKAERKRKRREARARELQEEQEALDAAREHHRVKKLLNQRKGWSDYVKDHPLECSSTAETETASPELAAEIEQKKMRHVLNVPPHASTALLKRTWTPKCPHCASKYAQPPPNWECPLCFRREKRQFLVWQPDSDSTVCTVCSSSIGRWSRHHCRSCGRLTCSRCCEARAVIPAMGYTNPVKVCTDCASKFAPPL